MLFLFFSNINIQFVVKALIQRFYIIEKALTTTQKIELINKKEFAKAALDEEFKTFVIYIVALVALLAKMTIYSSHIALISILKHVEALIKVLIKQDDYVNIFLFDLAIKLPENTSINQYAIELEKDKQLLYESIYSLELVKLKTFNIYIKNHLKTRFI